MNKVLCPLCEGKSPSLSFTKPSGETYFNCPDCGLLFLLPSYFLELSFEKAQYDLHENDILDPRYQDFMEPLVSELLRNNPGASGLDFGCGPTSVLTHLLQNQKIQVSLFDKFYFPDKDVLDRKYDFIFASEVVEHFQEPQKEWELLGGLLKDDGILVVGTSLWDDVPDLSRWSYVMDPTHVSFYSRKSFLWISKNFGFLEPMYFSKRGVFLRKRFSPL